MQLKIFHKIHFFIFLRKWTGLKLQLQAQGSVIAEEILSSMRRREGELFSSSTMLAAIYLDIFNTDLPSAE